MPLLLLPLLFLQVERQLHLAEPEARQREPQEESEVAHLERQLRHHRVLVLLLVLTGKELVRLAGALAVRRLVRFLVAA